MMCDPRVVLMQGCHGRCVDWGWLLWSDAMLRVDVGDSGDTATYGGGASNCDVRPAAFAHEYIHSSSAGSLRCGGRGSGGAVPEPGGMGSERWLYCEPRRVERELGVRWTSTGDWVGGVGSCLFSFIDCERVSVRAGTGADDDAVVAKNKGSDGRRKGGTGVSRGGVDCERWDGRCEMGVGGSGRSLGARDRAESGGVVPRLDDARDDAYCAGIWGTGGTSSP